jgi:cytochrome c-type biogenesis protein CcmH/NrfG
VWGEAATGYHVVNVLLHAVNAVLVWRVLQRLNVPGALLAALVFAVHPVNVATVAWISEQKNTLSMLFCLAAILFYLKFDEQGRWKWYGFSWAAFLLGLLSKSAVVMLPVALLGCVWWRRDRLRGQDFLHSIPFFILSLAFGLVTVWFQHHNVLRGMTVRAEGFLGRLAVAGCTPWFYLYKALLPVNLSAVYPRWGRVSFLPGVLLVGCFALFWWKRKTWGRPLLFALGSFVAMLFPVLGFFDQDFYQYSFVADPWQYYSIVGVIALVIAVIGQWKHIRIAAAVVVALLAVATWERSRVYASEETLWRDTVSKNPDGWMPHYNLGTALLHAGKLQEAIGQLESAARMRPDLVKVHSNLGIALAQAGTIDEAITELERALGIDSSQAEVRGNLAHALMLRGRINEAIEQWERALQLKPGWAEVHYDLGLALEQTGKIEEAAEQFRLALRFDPKMIEAQNELARVQAAH